MKDKILNWYVNGETGASSKVLASVALGQVSEKHHPLDPADFNRCLKLVRAVPEIKNYFDQISKLSPQWKSVIDNWDKIRESFVNEVGFDWVKGFSAPKTYHLMKELNL